MESKLSEEMKEHVAELKRAFEQVKLKLHLAGMDIRDAWKAVEPQLDKLESRLLAAGRAATSDVASSFEELGAALKKLGASIEKRAKGE